MKCVIRAASVGFSMLLGLASFDSGAHAQRTRSNSNKRSLSIDMQPLGESDEYIGVALQYCDAQTGEKLGRFRIYSFERKNFLQRHAPSREKAYRTQVAKRLLEANKRLAKYQPMRQELVKDDKSFAHDQEARYVLWMSRPNANRARLVDRDGDHIYRVQVPKHPEAPVHPAPDCEPRPRLHVDTAFVHPRSNALLLRWFYYPPGSDACFTEAELWAAYTSPRQRSAARQ